SDSGQTATTPARRKRLLAQALLTQHDLLETPLEDAGWSQHLPHRQNCRQYRECSEQSDRVVDGDPRRQPVGELKTAEVGAPHIWNFAILFMMTMPVKSIVTAIASRTSP